MQNRNATTGKNVEILFCNSIGNNPGVIQTLQNAFNIDAKYNQSIRTGSEGRKCDVKISFLNGKTIDATIKAYKEQAMFNQVARTTLKAFCETFDLDKSKLSRLFHKKALNANQPLVPPSKQNRWRDILEPKAKNIVRWALSSQPTCEILVLFSRNKNIMRIYKMTDILKQIKYRVKYTPRGNITIGECFVIQRKGGDGNNKQYPKIDPRHPSNNIQVKLNIRKFLSLFHPLAHYTT